VGAIYLFFLSPNARIIELDIHVASSPKMAIVDAFEFRIWNFFILFVRLTSIFWSCWGAWVIKCRKVQSAFEGLDRHTSTNSFLIYHNFSKCYIFISLVLKCADYRAGLYPHWSYPLNKCSSLPVCTVVSIFLGCHSLALQLHNQSRGDPQE